MPRVNLMSVVRVLMAQPNDPPSTLVQKATWLMFGLAGLVTCTVLLTSSDPFAVWVGIYSVPATFLLLLYMCVTKTMPQWLEAVCSVHAIIVVTFVDLSLLPIGQRGWSWFVILLDALITTRASERLRSMVVCWVICWIIITGLETGVRYGLLDWDALIDYDKRVKYCDKPPCVLGISATLTNVLQPLLVFIIDYKATSHFARAVDEEKAKVAAAVTLSRQVAECLAKFDLEGAEYCLTTDDADNLPEELAGSFVRLLKNLRSYRPYLPRSVLEDDCSDDSDSEDGCAGGNRHERTDTDLSATWSQSTGSPHSSPSASGASGTVQRSPMRDSAHSLWDLTSSNVENKSASATSPSTHARHHTQRLSLERSAGSGHTRANMQRFVQRKDVSLLMCGLRALRGFTSQHIDHYIPLHSEYLTVVLQLLRSNRGVMNYFVGDHVVASFNAFRPAPTHASRALSVGLNLMNAVIHTARAAVAVVTGPSLVGNLGTDTVLSHCVFGDLLYIAEDVLEAGHLLNHQLLCTRKTFMCVSMSFSLRILLHRVRMGRLSRKADPPQPAEDEVLYTFEDHPNSAKVDQGEAEEWMYAMQSEPGKFWELFNDAGWAYHKFGPAAGRQVFRLASTEGTMSERFTQELQSARCVDLAPRSHMLSDKVVVNEDDQSDAQSVLTEGRTAQPMSAVW